MKRASEGSSRLGGGLRVLALSTLAMAGVAALEAPARADACFGGPHIPNPGNHNDGGDAGDGATVGLLRRPAQRRKVGMGLVLVAGLGGAWLGTRRKGKGDGGGEDAAAPLK
jgi:hypothetical protein